LIYNNIKLDVKLANYPRFHQPSNINCYREKIVELQKADSRVKGKSYRPKTLTLTHVLIFLRRSHSMEIKLYKVIILCKFRKLP